MARAVVKYVTIVALCDRHLCRRVVRELQAPKATNELRRPIAVSRA